MNEGVEDRIRALIEPMLEAKEIELVDLAYLSEGGRKILRLFLDTPDGITIDEITRASREISTLLDVEDPISGRYSLEVSSPGLDRPLVKPEHFTAAVGKLVKIKTKLQIEGRRNFKGTLVSFEENVATLTDDEARSFTIRIEDIDKARLEVEF